MVSWSTQMRSLQGMVSGTALALALSASSAVAQDVPGDLWVVNYVKVTGANQNAVRSGLRSAADTYFYGFDTETHIEADVQDSGTFNLRIIGPGGKVLASQNGLPYDPSGNISRSVSASAQGWMNNLGCAEGCAVAVSGQAPVTTPEIDVAQAAEQAVERVEAATLAPELAVETAEVITPEEPSLPLTIVEAPKPVEPAVTVPSAPSVSEEVVIAAQPVETKKPEGLDADLVLARPNVAAAPSAGSSASVAPSVPKPVATPTVPQARAIATPNVATAPSAGTVSTVPATPTVTTEQPVVAAKPAEPSVPEVKVLQPTAETVETPEIATSAEVKQPSVAEVTPSVEAAPEETTVAATAPEQPAEQEITPGVSLPAPDAESTPATVAEIAEQAKPEVSVVTPESPSVATVVAPAATELETTAEVTQPEAPAPAAPAPATAEASDDGDGEQLALVNPQQPVTPLPTTPAPTESAEALLPKPEQVETPAEAASQPDDTETDTTVETRIAAVDPTAEGPTLANARWVGFTPAVFTGSDNKSGAWISGPFDRKQRTGWITDTATGATTRVTFIWREGGSGSRTALLSREAAKALGLGQGDVANVAVYLPR